MYDKPKILVGDEGLLECSQFFLLSNVTVMLIIEETLLETIKQRFSQKKKDGKEDY